MMQKEGSGVQSPHDAHREAAMLQAMIFYGSAGASLVLFFLWAMHILKFDTAFQLILLCIGLMLVTYLRFM